MRLQEWRASIFLTICFTNINNITNFTKQFFRMNYQLGNLEETVLLIVLYLDEVYGVSVAEEYKKQTGHGISIPAIHTVLRRLEDKGLLKSGMGESSPERGGRRKRLYEATAHGLNIIREIKNERMRLWSKIPVLKFKS